MKNSAAENNRRTTEIIFITVATARACTSCHAFGVRSFSSALVVSLAFCASYCSFVRGAVARKLVCARFHAENKLLFYSTPK